MERFIRERASALFAALAHPVRIRIVELLTAEGKSVNEIASTLQISQSGTSQHLSILTRTGVLVVEPKGSVRIYRLRGPRIPRILALIEEFCTVHRLFGPEDPPEAESDNPPVDEALAGGIAR